MYEFYWPWNFHFSALGCIFFFNSTIKFECNWECRFFFNFKSQKSKHRTIFRRFVLNWNDNKNVFIYYCFVMKFFITYVFFFFILSSSCNWRVQHYKIFGGNSFIIVLNVYGWLLICPVIVMWWHRRVIYQAVSSDDINYWNVARKCVAAVWDAHAWIYHGYEVTGMEHLPKDGPALIVYYHGAIPIDMYYFVARVCLERDRLVHTVADRFLFKLPGWGK